MKSNELLDWIVAIIVLLFIIVPFLVSLFTYKKAPPKRKVIRKPDGQYKEVIKNKPINLLDEKLMPPKAIATKAESQKKKLKYGSLKQAVILSEILNRPYSED